LGHPVFHCIKYSLVRFIRPSNPIKSGVNSAYTVINNKHAGAISKGQKAQHLSSATSSNCFRLRNDLYCVGWGVKLYSLTQLQLQRSCCVTDRAGVYSGNHICHTQHTLMTIMDGQLS